MSSDGEPAACLMTVNWLTMSNDGELVNHV